jgi:hypothetical protein
MLFWDNGGGCFYWCDPYGCYLPIDCFDDYPPDQPDDVDDSDGDG